MASVASFRFACFATARKAGRERHLAHAGEGFGRSKRVKGFRILPVHLQEMTGPSRICAGAAQPGQSPKQSCFEGCETNGTCGFPSPGYQHQVKKRRGRKARWTWRNGKGSAFANHQAEASFVMQNLSTI